MLTSNLFDQILVNPVNQGANKLFVVSGYATSAMAFHHLQFLREQGKQIEVQLIVGMCALDGMSNSNHRGFQELMAVDFRDNFVCSYLTQKPAVHSKVYSWFRDTEPVCAFLGSANYTQAAFRGALMEAADKTDPNEGFSYFQSLVSKTIYCTHGDAENLVQIYNDRQYQRIRRATVVQAEGIQSEALTEVAGLATVRVSFLANNETLPQGSGLNWGQRLGKGEALGREPNQAYIRLPASIYNTDFFPPRPAHFTVTTDDGKVLICARAQDYGKAIHTPHNNSLIGEYFRNRLGVANGAPVTIDDLKRYGRTHVDFYKIDEETYYMDFSVPADG